MPTGWNIEAMAVKPFLDNILLLDICGFEEFLNRLRNDEQLFK